MSSFNQKLRISVGSGILFALMNSHQLLSYFGKHIISPNTKCLTDFGTIFQVLLFALVTFLSMRTSSIDTLTKLKHTTYGALIFFFVSNPVTYRVTSSILGRWIANATGCPTIYGILLHTLVYIAILIGVMYFP